MPHCRRAMFSQVKYMKTKQLDWTDQVNAKTLHERWFESRLMINPYWVKDMFKKQLDKWLTAGTKLRSISKIQ